ncbi:hypothetical protein GCM10010151_01870 [Actinoallomurus spadix]|uniref:Uncharacterized protein n=1 Tax=Actinoallomurus spadix TaxID=79912 RepID=A0ABP3FG88_9ACTN
MEPQWDHDPVGDPVRGGEGSLVGRAVARAEQAGELAQHRAQLVGSEDVAVRRARGPARRITARRTTGRRITGRGHPARAGPRHPVGRLDTRAAGHGGARRENDSEEPGKTSPPHHDPPETERLDRRAGGQRPTRGSFTPI